MSAEHGRTPEEQARHERECTACQLGSLARRVMAALHQSVAEPGSLVPVIALGESSVSVALYTDGAAYSAVVQSFN